MTLEQKAEKYAYDFHIRQHETGRSKSVYEVYIDGFNDGAEFGYNKAKKDADKMKSQFLELCNLKDMRIAELEKANEWHYVKDELPPIKKEYNGRSELVLVLSKEKEMQYAQYVEKEKTWARGICEINFKPYAWKEIVLPKESE